MTATRSARRACPAPAGPDVPVVRPLATGSKINTSTSGSYRAHDGNTTAEGIETAYARDVHSYSR